MRFDRCVFPVPHQHELGQLPNLAYCSFLEAVDSRIGRHTKGQQMEKRDGLLFLGSSVFRSSKRILKRLLGEQTTRAKKRRKMER